MLHLNHIVTWSAAFAMTIAYSTNAHAQVGNLFNKAKEAIKNKTEEKAEKAAEKAAKKVTDRAASEAGLKEVELINLYEHNFSPSKEALAADPWAKSEKVPVGYTRSYKELHAAYEHLDPLYFPLQPYYKYPNIYDLGEERENYPYAFYFEMMEKFLSTPAGGDPSANVGLIGYNDKKNQELISSDGQKLALHKDEMFRYPLAARFFADPNSKQAVINLAFLLANNSHIVRLVREYDVPNTEGIAYAPNNWVFPYTQKDAAVRREAAMVYMGKEVISLDNIAETILMLYNQVEAQKEPYMKATYMIAANELYKRVLLERKDYQANIGKLTQQKAFYDRYSEGQEYIKILDAAVVMPEPQEMALTPGAMHKQLNAQILSLIKKQDPEVIHVVVINDSWNVHYNGIVPTDRAVMAWAVYKDKKTGKMMAHDYSFCEDYQGGGKYGKLRYKGIGMRTVKVK